MIMRHTRKIAAHLAVLALFLGVPAATACAGKPDHLIVSMVDLLTRPSDFEGKIVTVQGYLSLMRLYLTRDHAEISDSPSSIPVRGPAPELAKCSDAYVHVVGWFGLGDDGYGIVKALEVSRWADPRSRSMDKAWLSTCWKRE
jgi:hypothetical protein